MERFVEAIVALAVFVSDMAVADGRQQEVSSSPDWFLAGVIHETSPLVLSESGTLGEVTKRLPEIRELGVKMLYLMPIFHEVCDISYRDWLRWEMAYRRREGKDFSSDDLAVSTAKSTPKHGRYRANHVGTHDTERVHAMYPDIWRALVAIQYTLAVVTEN